MLKTIMKKIYDGRLVDAFDSTDSNYVVLEDVILFGPYGIPVTSDFKAIVSPLGTKKFAKHRLRYTLKKYGVTKIVWEYFKTRFLNKNYIDETVAYLIPRHGWPGLPNYGHWLCENLPQIEIIQGWESENGSKLKLLLGPTSSRSWLPVYLKFMSYSESDVINKDEVFIKVSKLVLPKLYFIHSFEFESNASGRLWGGRKLLEKIGADNPITSEFLFLSRQNMHRRRFVNYDDLYPILKKYNFNVINPEDYTAEDQIRMFSNAKIIAGPTGAAFANMIFATDATILYSWHIDDKINCWQNLAREMGFDYYHIKTKGVGRDGQTAIQFDLEIDVSDFERTLKDVFKKMHIAVR
jgi:hypothetical protein